MAASDRQLAHELANKDAKRGSGPEEKAVAAETHLGQMREVGMGCGVSGRRGGRLTHALRGGKKWKTNGLPRRCRSRKSKGKRGRKELEDVVQGFEDEGAGGKEEDMDTKVQNEV